MNRFTHAARPMSPQRHINGCESDANPAGHPKTSGQTCPFHNGTAVEPIRLRTRRPTRQERTVSERQDLPALDVAAKNTLSKPDRFRSDADGKEEALPVVTEPTKPNSSSPTGGKDAASMQPHLPPSQGWRTGGPNVWGNRDRTKKCVYQNDVFEVSGSPHC